jgi:DNA helicase IV
VAQAVPVGEAARWSAADAALLDELAGLIDRTPSLSHLMIDEAQDLSPMQCRALGRRCVTGSLTVLGDIAQGTSAWAVDDWPTLLAHLGKPDTRLAVLDRGFRVPAQIIEYAARLLPEIAPGLAAPTSVRRATGALKISATAPAALPDAVVRACRRRLAEDGSIGLIAADADIAGLYDRLRVDGLDTALLGRDEDALEVSRLVCVPASLAKGLEFDAVIVAEPGRIVDAEPRGLHRLHVVLTRAVSALHVLHAEPLPAALQAS